MVTAARVSLDSSALLDPAAGIWRGLGTTAIKLMATPLALQPSEYIQNKWKGLKHGETKEVRVAAAHNGQAIFFRIEWDDPSDDSHPNDMSAFPDQAGVMLPIKDDGVIEQMGEEARPVNMWLWRADQETPHYVTAMGRGTTKRHADPPLAARGSWQDGKWTIVISRPFNVNLPAADVVPLAPGVTHKCTFAVWQGANKERAGLKAYGAIWEPLEIEA
jgi:complex iron-sulfur molybdoenzyme family reductase subunit gamma